MTEFPVTHSEPPPNLSGILSPSSWKGRGARYKVQVTRDIGPTCPDERQLTLAKYHDLPPPCRPQKPAAVKVDQPGE